MTRRRRGDGMFDDFVFMFRELPLWCAPLGAAFVYGLLGYLGPWMVERQMAPNAPINGMAIAFVTFFRMVAPWVAGAVLLVGLMGAAERWADRTGAKRRRRRD